MYLIPKKWEIFSKNSNLKNILIHLLIIAISGVFRPAAESEQDQMDPLRNRLTGLDLSAGVNAHPQVPIPPDYFEETPGKLHALEEAAAMAAVINSGGSPRMTSGTSHHLSSLESSIQVTQ